MRINGKDKDGLYKNHMNYIKIRNKINLQESLHD